MTNFSSFNKKKGLINPENSLLLIPISIGIVILTSLLLFVYKPLTTKLNNEEANIKLLEEKISYIPLYKKYIKEVTININKAKQQQERLINIISDPYELDTILSEINRISIDNEIEIIKVITRPIIKYDKANSAKNSISKNQLILDPFLNPSITKHMFKLTLKGEFNRLVDFLKELELLQPIAITDEIDIKANTINSNKESIKLTMSLNLSTYAKVESDIWIN